MDQPSYSQDSFLREKRLDQESFCKDYVNLNFQCNPRLSQSTNGTDDNSKLCLKVSQSEIAESNGDF